MKNSTALRKDGYSSAKISVLKGNLFGTEKIHELAKMEFDEILRFLEENGFRSSVNKAYLQYDGFYLVERVLNDYLSKMYSKVFVGTNKENQELLEAYYLKYQAHNMMVVVRCKLSGEKDFESYLIGDSRKKEKYIKAYDMPNVEDALVYLAKKLGFDSKIVLEKYGATIYELENYLYKTYYSKLKSLNFVYNDKDEKLFTNFINNYIDLLNARAFLRLKYEFGSKNNFEELFMIGGTLNLSDYQKLESKSVEECLDYFKKVFGDINLSLDLASVETLDKRISMYKKSAETMFKNIKFGSPFFGLRFLFKVEREVGMLRILLKAKFLKLSEEETMRLL